MNKKIITILIIIFVSFLVLTPLSLALSPTDDPRNLGGGQGWNDYKDSVVDTLGSYIGLSSGKSTKQVNILFYPVQEWEVQACAYGLSTDVKDPQTQTIIGQSTDVLNVYDMTATITAQRTVYTNDTLYELAWYVQPKDAVVNYNVYMINNNGDKFYLPNKKNIVSDPVQGSAGYLAFYNNQTYNKAVIETAAGSKIVETFIPIMSVVQ